MVVRIIERKKLDSVGHVKGVAAVDVKRVRINAVADGHEKVAVVSKNGDGAGRVKVVE